MVTRFEWDPAKAESNRAKHGLAFEEAIRVFQDPNLVQIPDQRQNDEERWQTIGAIAGHLIVLVAHTIKESEQVEVLRIISARRATRKERERYYEK